MMTGDEPNEEARNKQQTSQASQADLHSLITYFTSQSECLLTELRMREMGEV